jgi:hypothetical protein
MSSRHFVDLIGVCSAGQLFRTMDIVRWRSPAAFELATTASLRAYIDTWHPPLDVRENRANTGLEGVERGAVA